MAVKQERERKRVDSSWRTALLTFAGIESASASDEGSGVHESLTRKQRTKADRPTYTSDCSGGTPMRAEFTGDKPTPGGDPAKKEVSAWREQAAHGEALKNKANPAQNSALAQKPSAWRDAGSTLLNDRGGRAETLKDHALDGQGAKPKYKVSAWRTGGRFQSRASSEVVELRAVGLWEQLKTAKAVERAQVVQPTLSAQGALKGYKVVTAADAEFKPKQVVVAFIKKSTGTLTVTPLSDFVNSFAPMEVQPFDQRQRMTARPRTAKTVEIGTPTEKRESLLKKGWRAMKNLLATSDGDILDEQQYNQEHSVGTGLTRYTPKNRTMGNGQFYCNNCGYMSPLSKLTPQSGTTDMGGVPQKYSTYTCPECGAKSSADGTLPRMGGASHVERVVRGQRGKQAGVDFTKKPDGQINISVEADPVNGMGTQDMVNGQPVGAPAQPATPAPDAPEAPEAQPPQATPGVGETPGPVKQPAPTEAKKASVISVGQALTDPELGEGQVESIVGDRVVAVFGGRQYETTIHALSAL